MTLQQDVAKIEELLKNTTAGPWYGDNDDNYGMERVYGHNNKSIADVIGDSAETEDNRELIVILRNSISSLLAERKALREAVKDFLHDGMPLYEGGERYRADREKAKKAMAGGESDE